MLFKPNRVPVTQYTVVNKVCKDHPKAITYIVIIGHRQTQIVLVIDNKWGHDVRLCVYKIKHIVFTPSRYNEIAV